VVLGEAFGFVILYQNFLIDAQPRELFCRGVVHEHTQSKGICLEPINVLNEGFRWHVERTTDSELLFDSFIVSWFLVILINVPGKA
jgi:hypothetical protein